MIRIEAVNKNGSIDACGNSDDEKLIKNKNYPKDWGQHMPLRQGSTFFNTKTRELLFYDEDSQTWE